MVIIQTFVVTNMKQENRGGVRAGAGRPQTNLKTHTVRCYPDVIETVREFAKLKNKDYEKQP